MLLTYVCILNQLTRILPILWYCYNLKPIVIYENSEKYIKQWSTTYKINTDEYPFYFTCV